MRIEDLSEDQALTYFKARLGDSRLRRQSRPGEYKANCIWHSDVNPSLQFNTIKKTFNCFSCGRKGGLVEFEKELLGVDSETAIENIAEITGTKLLAFSSRGKPDYTFDYVDEDGVLLAQKLRWDSAGRKFLQWRCPDGAGWKYQRGDGRRVLYRLPEVISASGVMVTEGEKDCELIRNLDWAGAMGSDGELRLGFTSPPDGAGSWRDEYAPYFSGKRTVIFQDNDDAGIKHAQQVALSLYRFTKRIKVVSTPEHDIGDWIEAGATARHVSDLIEKTPGWVPPDTVQGFFVDVETFERMAPLKIDWAVEGLIEKGSNGILIAIPKAGKSWLATQLALCLASGREFLGHSVPNRQRTAICMREDNPVTGSRRIRMLRGGIGDKTDLGDYLYINTKRQRARLMLDNNDELEDLIFNCKLRNVEFLILDVFNRLHSKDENDNTAIRGVLDQVEHIQDAVGCSVCLVHHTPKREDYGGSVVMGARGAGAIAGFAEFAGRIDVVERFCSSCGKPYGLEVVHRYCPACEGKVRTVRKLRWDSKADEEAPVMYWRIDSDDKGKSARIELMDEEYEPPEREQGR